MDTEDYKIAISLIDSMSQLIKQGQKSILEFNKMPATEQNITNLFKKNNIYFEALRIIQDILYNVMDNQELMEKINLLYQNAHDFVVNNINLFNVPNKMAKLLNQQQIDKSNNPSTSSNVQPLEVENLNKLRKQNRVPSSYIERLKIIDDWVKKINNEVPEEIHDQTPSQTPHQVSSNSSQLSSNTSTGSSGSDSLYRSSERLNTHHKKQHFTLDAKELTDRLNQLLRELEWFK